MTISETTTRGFDALTTETKSAYEMALTGHNLSQDGKYARTTDDDVLWIWSDRRAAWVAISNA